MSIASRLALKFLGTPSGTASGEGWLYFKSDGRLYKKIGATESLLEGAAAPAILGTAPTGGAVEFLRIATINTGGLAGGAAISLIVSGQGPFTQGNRVTDVLHFTAYASNNPTLEGWRMGSNTSPWVYYRRNVSTYQWELWVRRASDDLYPQVQIINAHNAQLNMDAAAGSQPVGLSGITAPTKIMRAGDTPAIDTLGLGANSIVLASGIVIAGEGVSAHRSGGTVTLGVYVQCNTAGSLVLTMPDQWRPNRALRDDMNLTISTNRAVLLSTNGQLTVEGGLTAGQLLFGQITYVCNRT